jgi:thiol-disulfide isomerase/thioredoxin
MFRNSKKRSTWCRGARGRVRYGTVLLVLTMWPGQTIPAAENTAASAGPAARGVLHLAGGGFAPGVLVPSSESNRLRWQADAFVVPFDFAVAGVNAIHFPVPSELPRPVGDYCFELAGGDVLFGSLIALDQKRAEIDVSRLGRIHVQRSSIKRMYRWRSSGDLIYLGPNGLVGWREVSAKPGWREEQGQPWTDQEGAAIRGDFKLPARATIEFELSWKNKPDFVLALGVSDDEKAISRAFRFEVWERDLIIQRETEQEADVASVGEIAPGPGRIHRIAYLDQDKGRILVFSVDGKPLADLKVAGGPAQAMGSLQLANKRGDLRLERLRIGRWNGEPPRQVEADRSRIHRVDGSILYGQVGRFDAASRTFVVETAGQESRIPEEQLAGVFLSLPGEDGGRTLAVVYQDGSRLSGSLDRVEQSRLLLSVPGIEEPLGLPLSGLRSLVSLRPQETPVAIGGMPGVLELEGLRLSGKLVDGREQAGASCLVWLPQGSSTSSPARQNVSGRIVYREPPPRRPVARRPTPPAPQGPGGFVVGFLSALGGSQPAEATGKRKSLYLRSGDVIPSEITRIDETGVFFRTALSASTFVPHDKVKAVELTQQGETTIKINKPKRERLMMLPRMQKENPPTHLIRSRSGDFIRGRLIKMDEHTLQVEMRLEPKDIPRDRLALIVWLHPEEILASRKAAPPTRREAGTRLQAVCNDGIRLTFHAQQLVGDTLSGKSDVLGPCQVRLREVDQILIGDGIEKAAAQLVYQQWKLQNAPEPKAAQDDGGPSSGGRLPGTESALVGKPAPDFELELLAGAKFHLTQNKGTVVILDFWATWCGPCLQAMPQVERVAAEFHDRNVRLVAVNLQEDAKQISAMLERHKLRPEVALDRDGVVAEKYAATAIPQTVIIDGEGTVVRVFVGGGSHLGDQLRDALASLFKQSSAKQPATKSP